MSNEFVTASANFISESYSRENAGNIDFQEENTAYLIGIYEATKELLTDIIAEAEETDDEVAEEIADELIFNEEVFDYIDSLIDDEYLSEDVYIVPFSSFSVYLEETTEKCYANILTEEYVEEGIAGLLARGAGALFKGLKGVERAGGFRGVAAAGARTARSAIGSGLQSTGKAIESGASRAATKAYIGAERARQGIRSAGKSAIQGVGYGVEKTRQGVQAARQGIRSAGKSAIQGVGYGVEKTRQGVERARQSAANVAGGIRRAGAENLAKLRQFGAEKIKQGQQLASNIRQGVMQKAGELKQSASEKFRKIKQVASDVKKNVGQDIRAGQQRAQVARQQRSEKIRAKIGKVKKAYQTGVEKAREGK